MSGLLRLQGETAAELRRMLLSWYVVPIATRVFAAQGEVNAIVLVVDGSPGAARLAWQLARAAEPALPLRDPIASDVVDRAHRRLHGEAVLDPDRLQLALHALATGEPRPWAVVRRATNASGWPSVAIDLVAEPVRPDLPWPPLLAVPESLTLQEARMTLVRADDWDWLVAKLREAVALLAGRLPDRLPNLDRHLENGEHELRGRSEERW